MVDMSGSGWRVIESTVVGSTGFTSVAANSIASTNANITNITITTTIADRLSGIAFILLNLLVAA